MKQAESAVGLECFIISLGSRLLKEMPFTADFLEVWKSSQVWTKSSRSSKMKLGHFQPPSQDQAETEGEEIKLKTFHPMQNGFYGKNTTFIYFFNPEI